MDDIFRSFLDDSYTKTAELAAESDILRVIPHPLTHPPTLYLLVFEPMEYLRDTTSGVVEVAKGVLPVEVRFPLDYLRSTDPVLYLKIATLVDPVTFALPHPDFFHPNHDPLTGALCLGANFRPGTPLNALIWHLYDILTYANFSVHEHNALNPAACRYWREHPEEVSRLRITPLRRRRLKATVGT